MAEFLERRVYQPSKGEDAHKKRIETPMNASSEEARRKADQHDVSTSNVTEAAPRPPSRNHGVIHMSKQRQYIEPATPFLPGYPTGSKKDYFKNRAVTEPIRESATVAPLFSSPKTKPVQPKKSRSSKDNKELPALPPSTSAKAAAVLGETVPPPPANKAPANTPSASAPATTVKFNRGSNNTESYTPGDSRQVKSQPGPPTLRFNEDKQGQPTSRFYTENIESSLFTIPFPSQFDSPTPPPPPPKPDAMILGDGFMSPTKAGTYARLGNVNVMPPPPRKESMSGAIEHTGNIEGQPPNQYYQPSGLGLGYSPSVYGDGFEDPPPTAALHPYRSSNAFQDQQRQTSGDSHSLNISQNSQASKMTLPFVFNGRQSELTPTGSNPRSAPPTAVPSYAPEPHISNSVPPHSNWISSPRAAEADRFIYQTTALHVQIANETKLIAHKIDNRHDVLVDHIIRRYESAQAIQAEYQNDLRQGLSAVEHNLGRVVGEVRHLGSRFEEEVVRGRRLGGGGNKKKIGNGHDSGTREEGLEATLEKLVRMGEVAMGKLDELAERVAVVERKVDYGSCGCNRTSSSVPSTSGSLQYQQHTPNTAVHQGQIHNQRQNQNQSQYQNQNQYQNYSQHSNHPQNQNQSANATNHSSPQKQQPQQQQSQQQQQQPQYPARPASRNDHQRHRSPEHKLYTTEPQESPDLRDHPAFKNFVFAEPARVGGSGYNAGWEQRDLKGQGQGQRHWYQQLYERGA